MMAATHCPAAASVVKPSIIGRAPSALRQDAHGRLSDDAELALRADDEGEEVIALRVEECAADLDDLAVHQHHAQAEHVVGRDAVLQAVRAARVHGEVAAERAGELARGIGRVEEAFAERLRP